MCEHCNKSKPPSPSWYKLLTQVYLWTNHLCILYLNTLVHLDCHSITKTKAMDLSRWHARQLRGRRSSPNSFYNKMWFSTFSSWGKQSLSEQKQRWWGRRESPHNFYAVESAKGVCYFLGGLTHYWLSWNPLLCKATKLKVGHGVPLLLPLPVVGQIPFHSFWRTVNTKTYFIFPCSKLEDSIKTQEKEAIYLYCC